MPSLLNIPVEQLVKKQRPLIATRADFQRCRMDTSTCRQTVLYGIRVCNIGMPRQATTEILEVWLLACRTQMPFVSTWCYCPFSC